MHCKRSGLIIALCFLSILPASDTRISAQAATPSPSANRKTSTPYTLHINRVMDLLGVQPGTNVADIGAGSGWFTVRAARRVTPTGTVYAVDINPAAIRYISERAAADKLGNIKTVLSAPDDPRLPPDSVDSVLLLKTYHEVAKPVELLRKLQASLRSRARIGIVDRNGNGQNHGVSKEVVIREAGEAGYRLVDEQDDLVKDDNMDYFLIFNTK